MNRLRFLILVITVLVGAVSVSTASEILVRPEIRPENFDVSQPEQAQYENATTLQECYDPVFKELVKLGRPTVTLQLNMSEAAKVIRVRPLGIYNSQLYSIARSAFMDCGNHVGFNLPVDKYEHWRVIEITFDTTVRGVIPSKQGH
ncbi:hypothetical protein N9P29_00715 [bacterium]|nr:hypothetical protein [bacterium]